MKVVKISGGLGNQIFQYAFGRGIEYINDEKVYFDISFYDSTDVRDFELGKFGIHPPTLTSKKINGIFPLKKAHPGFKRIITERFPNISRNIFNYTKELHRDRIAFGSGYPVWWKYHESIQNISGSMYYDGLWQCENYFSCVESEVRSELIFDIEQEVDSYSLLNLIRSGPSVSVHIRRGDYVNLGYQLPLSYYYSAMTYVRNQCEDCTFFVFSDDIEWVKTNLHCEFEDNCVFIEPHPAHVDLRLMSECDAHIIANSTFSWWGAWLDPDTNAIVICPARWRMYENTRDFDIIPERWIILDW